MLSEIGSNFWECNFARSGDSGRFFWMDAHYNKQYFKSGRNAIKGLCRCLSNLKRDVMVPIYTCETVIQPFIDEGWNVSYYLVNKNLTINKDAFLKLFDKKTPSVVLVHSFFGFNTLEDEQCLQYCKGKGAIIVEDMTQSLFSDHHVSCADYYVTSFRKFLAIPDGGVLISNNKLCDFDIEEANPRIASVATEAFMQKADYFKNETIEKKDAFRKLYQELNELIGVNDKLYSISPISLEILLSCSKQMISESRQKNYLTIIDGIHDLNYISGVIDSDENSSAPLYCPVYVDNRYSLQTFLAKEKVYCPIIWPKPPQIEEVDEVAEYMYEHMLCIPIDQRYGFEEMNKIIGLLRRFSS